MWQEILTLQKKTKKVSCDIAMVPIGGTYTMDAKKAAKFVNIIKPRVAISIHYGSVVGTKKDEEIFRTNVDKSIKVEIKMQSIKINIFSQRGKGCQFW